MDIQIGSNAIYTASMQVFNYRVDVGGVTIYRGRAIASPSGRVTVNVSNIVEDYLNSEEFPKRNVDPILYSEDGGYAKARLYRINADETTTLVGEYGFLRSYDIDWSAGIYDSREEVWTGQSITMSNPINGRLDPRMQQLYTVYRRTSGETISWGIVPKFRIVPNKINADPDGGTYTLIIEANVPFTATTDSGWVSISGSGDTYVVTVTPNPGEGRNGGIILSYLDENDNTATTVIPVVQEAVNARIIPESISFGPDGGESRFTVVSNIDVTPTTSADWLTFVPIRTGDGFVTYKLVAASNRDNTEDRTATINARGAVLTVNQEAFAVSVVIDKTEYNWEGEEGTLTVTANGYYEITTDSDWITISPSSGYSGVTSFNIEVEENDTDSGRTGYINVGGTIIEITQEKQALVSIKPETWMFPATGGSVTFAISDRHNRGWNFSGTTGVLRLLSQTEGTGNTQVTMTVGAATTASVRTFILSLESESTGESIRLQLRQAAPVITVTPSTIEVPATGGTFSFTVESEVNFRLYQYNNDGDWITLSATSGTAGTTTFTFTADTTTSQFERRGYVRVFNTRKLTVIQEAAVISVSPSAVTLPIEGSSSQLTITSNVDYGISASAEWLTLSATGGTAGTTVLTISAPANTAETRTTEITVGYQTVAVKQKGDIIISPTSANFDYNSGTTTVTIISDDDYSISTEDDWITLSASGGTSGTTVLQITVSENNFKDRTGTVTIGGKTFTITQTAALAFQYLTLEIVSGGTVLFNYDYGGETQTIWYSLNGDTWRRIFVDNTGERGLTVAAGDSVRLRGDNSTYRYTRIGTLRNDPNGALFDLKGNLCTLTDYGLFSRNVSADFQFEGLFKGVYVRDASKLILPLNTRTGCYQQMFAGCGNLVNPPELPSTSLTPWCYAVMFASDAGGVAVPLYTAPSLPALTLAEGCYSGMFQDSPYITTAPDLLSTGLEPYCYQYMFKGCSRLNFIRCYRNPSVDAHSAFTEWVDGVASTGTFVIHQGSSTAQWETNRIPTGWTVINE